jgi:DNA-binding SARP family transcriptional activator
VPERPISYHVLGPLTVRVGDDSRTPTARKHRLLLAQLLLGRGETVSLDQLNEALWGERVPASARKLVQLYVHELRELLGRDTVETAVDGYRLNVDLEEIDSVRFERLAAEGRALFSAGNTAGGADVLRRALQLWRGPAYSEMRHEDFVRVESERLDELRLDCLERTLEAEAALGDPSAAIAELQALVSERPDREGPRAALMRAHYRAGRQADALAVYEDGRAYLDDELGLEPSPQLRELQRRILNHDLSLAAAADGATRRLPAAPTSGC